MTAHWESQLTDISQKQATYQQFMHNLNQMLPDLVRFVDLNALRQLSRIKMIKSDIFFMQSTCEKIEFSITFTTSFLAKLQIREKKCIKFFYLFMLLSRLP